MSLEPVLSRTETEERTVTIMMDGNEVVSETVPADATLSITPVKQNDEPETFIDDNIDFSVESTGSGGEYKDETHLDLDVDDGSTVKLEYSASGSVGADSVTRPGDDTSGGAELDITVDGSTKNLLDLFVYNTYTGEYKPRKTDQASDSGTLTVEGPSTITVDGSVRAKAPDEVPGSSHGEYSMDFTVSYVSSVSGDDIKVESVEY